MDDRTKTVLHASLSLPAFLLASSIAWAGAGTDTAHLMNYYYSRTVEDCGEGRPAFWCSGLLLRGTENSDQFNAWNPSPASEKSGGVSMSYLRKDSEYQDLGLLKTNGFVLKPNDFIEKDQRKANVLCFFPIDAWTDDRSDAGCADNTKTTDRLEKICQSANIKTAEAWLKDYRSVRNDHKRQCGFEIDDRPDDAYSFYQGIRARQMIKDESMETQTEVRVQTWPKDLDGDLPIMAFIYTEAKGLAGAKADQQKYYKATAAKGKAIWLPVIKADLPRTSAQNARFTYNPADQSVPEPRADNPCTSYIADANWEKRFDPGIEKEAWTLSVKPTECGRKLTPAQTEAAYAELFNKYGSDPRWTPDNGSMRRQFVCHLTWTGKDKDTGKTIRARDKNVWNLEPFRPYVSQEDALKADCNPFLGTP